MNSNLLMLVFDGLPLLRLKLYGGLVGTPNLEKLITVSTSYSNMITAAPSTAMSFTSMFTGLFPHEFGRRSYSNVDSGLPPGTTSLFQELEKEGYHTYVLWHKDMETANPVKYRINAWQGTSTKFMHYKRPENKYLRKLEKKILHKTKKGKIWFLEETFAAIKKLESPWALFIRFNEEVSPRFRGSSKNKTNYKCDDEIHEIDYVISKLMGNYPDNTKLILSSDHGHMHGEQGILGYAFNLSEGTMKVPFIIYDPANPGKKVIDDLISLINYKNIILNKPLRKTRYLYADTAYADQWHRKTMIRKSNFKYIYHRDRWPCKEQLFDLSIDPHEMTNLALPVYTDPYRDSRPKGDTVSNRYSPSGANYDGKPLHEILPRTDWDEVLSVLEELRQERKRIWASQNVFE